MQVMDFRMWYYPLYRLLALTLLFLISPLLGILYIFVKSDSPGPFIFSQKRTGKDEKPFIMYKIRTMKVGADALKNKYIQKNEADGPVFKILNDPRFTRVGRWLSRSGLDELPQLWNIVKGEMSFVGPRPLPVSEAEKVPRRYKKRFSVLPGITSPWVVNGSHLLSFKAWMELDLAYVQESSLIKDIFIMVQTAVLLLQLQLRALGRLISS